MGEYHHRPAFSVNGTNIMWRKVEFCLVEEEEEGRVHNMGNKKGREEEEQQQKVDGRDFRLWRWWSLNTFYVYPGHGPRGRSVVYAGDSHRTMDG